MADIFTTKGTTFSISGISFWIGDDDQFQIGPVKLNVHFDVCPTWIQIAIRHLDTALQARLKRKEAWEKSDENLKASTLEAEFESSMQAIMAAAIAWDSLYSVLCEHVVIPADTCMFTCYQTTVKQNSG